mmetsp:Transcript_32830/g.94191  ORF Transcript_32830/g.94191 Transcript_32830/m.94191 type:complete len:247 (+) Transcript_32830:448-1188(+)
MQLLSQIPRQGQELLLLGLRVVTWASRGAQWHGHSRRPIGPMAELVALAAPPELEVVGDPPAGAQVLLHCRRSPDGWVGQPHLLVALRVAEHKAEGARATSAMRVQIDEPLGRHQGHPQCALQSRAARSLRLHRHHEPRCARCPLASRSPITAPLAQYAHHARARGPIILQSDPAGDPALRNLRVWRQGNRADSAAWAILLDVKLNLRLSHEARSWRPRLLPLALDALVVPDLDEHQSAHHDRLQP